MPRFSPGPLPLALCLSCLSTVHAATWDRLGPTGGRISSLSIAATDPRVIYAGGAFVYRSTDGGAHWTRTADVFPLCGPEAAPPVVKAVLACPRDPNRAAVASAQGLFLTTNGGASWIRAAAIAGDVSCMSYSSDGRRLYVSVGDTLYRSMNSGDTWDSLSVPAMRVLCSDPLIPTAFIAVRSRTDGAGRTLFRTDDGTGWYPFSSFAPPTAAAIVPSAMGDAVFIGSADAAGGVWRVTRAGAATQVLSTPVVALACTRSAPCVLLAAPAGGYPATRRTMDDGATWTSIQIGSASRNPISLAIGPDLVPIAGTEHGGVMIADAADAWHVSNVGLGMASLTGAAQSADTARVLLAAALDGLYRSTNGGDTWVLCHPSTTRSAMAVTPAKAGRVWHTSGEGLEKSEDNGQTWRRFTSGLPAGAEVGRIVPHPALPDTVFAVTSTGAVYQTSTSVVSWALRLPAFSSAPTVIPDLAIAPSDPSTVYAIREDGLYLSTDTGAHWTRQNASVSPAAMLAVKPTDAQTLFRANTSGTVVTVARSTNAGVTWNTLRTETGAANSGFAATFLAADARQPNRLLLGTNRGLRVSDDGGTTWRVEPIGTAAVFSTSWAPCGTSGDLLATAGAGLLRTRPASQGALTAADAVRIIRMANSGATPTLADLEYADVNENGRITLSDADLALRSATGP